MTDDKPSLYTAIHRLINQQQFVVLEKQRLEKQARDDVTRAEEAFKALSDLELEMICLRDDLDDRMADIAFLEHQLEILEYIGDNQPVNLTAKPLDWPPAILRNLNQRGLIVEDANDEWSLDSTSRDGDDRHTDVTSNLPFIEIVRV